MVQTLKEYMLQTLKEYYDDLYGSGYPTVSISLGGRLCQTDTYEEFVMVLESAGLPSENIIPRKMWEKFFRCGMNRFMISNYPDSFEKYSKDLIWSENARYPGR